MPTIAKDQAISRLTEAIHALRPDDVTEVYNELFPEDPSDATSVKANPSHFQEQIFDYIEKGLEVEEILALWRVVFPKNRRVHFNEETNELTYRDQQVLYAD